MDGAVVDVNEPPHPSPQKAHCIEAVIDRVVVREGVRPRLAESINLAVRHGEGLVMASREEKQGGQAVWRDELFSVLYACPDCKVGYEELEPRTFSFNSPYGACPLCDGLGSRVAFDPELVAPRPELSLADGAIAPWKDISPAVLRRLKNFLRPWMTAAGVNWSTPLAKLKPKMLEQLLGGDGKDFPGALTLLEKEYATTSSEARRQRLETFRGEVVCPECKGARLRPEARAVRFAGRAIHEATAMTVEAARRFFASFSPTPQQEPIARPILREIMARLDFLDNVGLEYLTLDRAAGTLSGGELQRVRLATGLGSGLVGVCYVLDEPSIGLHPRDNRRLIAALRSLQSRGNTVVVVEHDETIMREADWLVDLGPAAGRHGGCVVAQGTPARSGRGRLPHGPVAFRPPADSHSPAAPRHRPRDQSPSKAPRRTT